MMLFYLSGFSLVHEPIMVKNLSQLRSEVMRRKHIQEDLKCEVEVGDCAPSSWGGLQNLTLSHS